MKIAITGKMCSGKTTLANYLLSLNPKFQIFSFGKKVKEVASDLFHMDPEIKNRSLLTSIGQKMREIDPNVWVNYVIHQTKDVEFCLVDDLRYQNEYEALVQNEFKIIQLTIPSEVQENRIREIYPNNYLDHLKNRDHLSEKNEFEWLHGGPDLKIDSTIDPKSIKEIITYFLGQFQR